MKSTAAQTEKLLRLAKGETLPASMLKDGQFEQMVSDGMLIAVTRGSRKSYRARDERSLRSYIAAHFGIRDLEQHHELLREGEAARAEQVRITGDSKAVAHRTFCGFMVNCYDPIPVALAGKSFELLPEEGTFVFIYDFKTFSIPGDIVVVGVENAENFRYIVKQRHLFESTLSKDTKLLFVSRYPQQQSRDLMEWLASIPNRYIHFGDLDLAGVHIYLSEYYIHLGEILKTMRAESQWAAAQDITANIPSSAKWKLPIHVCLIWLSASTDSTRGMIRKVILKWTEKEKC